MWAELARDAAKNVPNSAVDAVADALDYLCLAQLYLRDNLLLHRPLVPTDIKARPSGHWGVCPSVNRILAALGPLQKALPDDRDLQVLHGAGHAGPSALAHGYLTGRLGRAHPDLAPGPDGLHHLVTGFPLPGLGGEITPLIPGHLHTGGQLGPALAVAQGTVLDAPHRLTVALIGDGECETGTTASAWLAARAFRGTGPHGTVLPIVLLNGQKMGGPSLLSTLTPTELDAYFTGLGHQPFYSDGHDTAQLRQDLTDALNAAHPLGTRGPASVLVLTLDKGHGAPAHVAHRPVAGTSAVHKTPLSRPADDPDEFAALACWLAAYRPGQLLTPDGRPRSHLLPALPVEPHNQAMLQPPRGCIAASTHVAETAAGRTFSQAVSAVIRARAAQGSFRVFSPDELASNRIDLCDEHGQPAQWAVEILNEEICHSWAQGYTETGRHALVIGYEAFAPITTSLIQQQLKHRAMRRHAQLGPLPSIVHLLTSLGWHNTYTHQNPALTSALLATCDPSVHVLTPADPARTAAALTFALRKLDRCTLVIAGKHPTPEHPLETLDEELRHGIATWPHLSHPHGKEPDLVLVSAGDLPAERLTALAHRLRTQHPHLRLRYVHVHDLTTLAEHGSHPLAMPDDVFAAHLGTRAPIILATSGYPADIHALLGRRHPGHRLTVLGYRDPGRPHTQAELLAHCGLDDDSLWQLATNHTPLTTEASAS
ncbi:phosphoketolase (plasmid) [Streptomyces sp. NBC_01340]|uniref:phosphoketolase family protein n=1 Tax=unclassified Streptomyces TaxID=2593676 RepID=UPI00225B0738|nr:MULTISPECIES: phosphoketolase [unclassified Streptomyces]MCX4461157.1 phosphoketolase [Streptomyces sp. NBC_01719]MCX4499514.1 phosphoketolase [Streptomyces sp. NBC_01728]WSI44655.1 phosphoketolase [Streptomyces sp. NBC_01340]